MSNRGAPLSRFVEGPMRSSEPRGGPPASLEPRGPARSGPPIALAEAPAEAPTVPAGRGGDGEARASQPAAVRLARPPLTEAPLAQDRRLEALEGRARSLEARLSRAPVRPIPEAPPPERGAPPVAPTLEAVAARPSRALGSAKEAEPERPRSGPASEAPPVTVVKERTVERVERTELRTRVEHHHHHHPAPPPGPASLPRVTRRPLAPGSRPAAPAAPRARPAVTEAPSPEARPGPAAPSSPPARAEAPPAAPPGRAPAPARAPEAPAAEPRPVAQASSAPAAPAEAPAPPARAFTAPARGAPDPGPRRGTRVAGRAPTPAAPPAPARVARPSISITVGRVEVRSASAPEPQVTLRTAAREHQIDPGLGWGGSWRR